VQVTLWGTRGSVPTPGPETLRYGGNTSCVEVRALEHHAVILDAGSGITRLGNTITDETTRIDILLTHLHMDHILGLGFFAPFHRPDLEVHMWGPSSITRDLRSRLSKYMSPPLFPLRLHELECQMELHDVPIGEFDIPGLHVRTAKVCHPGPTVGYRLDDGQGAITYLPDHEPALGSRHFPEPNDWMSGYELAEGVDLLIHDAQYDESEYESHIGWGHSTIDQTLAFAKSTDVEHLVAFHHDPSHDDGELERLFGAAIIEDSPFTLSVGAEGDTYQIGAR
jgi:phosphoribosyl 1,2-cyclic phosphodiesterase